MRKTVSVSILSVLLAALSLLLSANIQAYTISGSIRAWTNGDSGDMIDREEYFVDGAVLFNDWGSVSGNNQSAEAGYFTNLSTALVGAYVGASDFEPDSGSSAAYALAEAGFQDRLTFTVPEGNYPAGVNASLAGFVSGNLGAFGETAGLISSVRAQGTFFFGGDAFTFDETARGEGPTGITIDENFALVTQLVAPGATVPTGGLQIARSVSVYLQTYGTPLHATGYPDAPDSSWIVGDMYNAAGFTSLSVPAGVAWSSASGVFLSQLDSDLDGVADALDNCLLVPNRNQNDADGDGLGNICDADLNQDCNVNFQDLSLLRQVFFSADPVADFDSSGQVNFADLMVVKQGLFQAPGPGAEPNLCSP